MVTSGTGIGYPAGMTRSLVSSSKILSDEATDCHFHVFDPRYPMLPGRDRAAATVAQYKEFRHQLGLSRGVIVAPSSYGYDNRCLLDALAELGRDSYRAVVIPRQDATVPDWQSLHEAGVRGLRLYVGHSDFPAPTALHTLACQAADHGWHLQLVGEQTREAFVEMEDVLATLACPLVFDHFGFAPQPAGARSRTAQVLRRLIDRGRSYVKLSGMYIQSATQEPDFTDFDELAIGLVKQAPERLLWGSDWPHTLAPRTPDGHRLLNAFERWAPDAAVQRSILVDNPTRLYWA